MKVSAIRKSPLRLLGLAALISVASVGLSESRSELLALQSQRAVERAPLYLPRTEKVRLITLGFERFTADILWFNTLNYFGKQYSRGLDFKWLGHMCELVSDLDPKNIDVIEFCATMLSWVAQDPETSTKLLRKSVSYNPEYWRLQYLLGFNYWYFHEQKEKAKNILQQAAQLPAAPPFLASLAARLTVDTDDPQIALQFLQSLHKRTKDPEARAALEEKLRLAEITRDISLLNAMIERYENAYNQPVATFDQLIEAGMLREHPKDPFDEPYVLDPEKREIISRRGKRGLVFQGTTAATGLARFERRAGLAPERQK